MVELLRCQDRWGRWIVLDTDQWNDHVLVGHPELAGFEDRLRATLTAPDYVTEDRDHSTREHFYRSKILPDPWYRTFLNVCVDFQEGIGFVVTAFPSRRIHPKERQQWP